MYMLDTNICIYIIKAHPKAVRERLSSVHIKDVCISSITQAELFTGVEKSQNIEQNREALSLFLAPLQIIPFGNQAALAYGTLRAALERKGTPIGSMDTLIAAHALSASCVLVTNYEREFRRVPNLIIENWSLEMQSPR